MRIKKAIIKNIIILTVVACFSYGLGIYNYYKVSRINEQSIVISHNVTDLKTPDKAGSPNGMTDANINEDDPLIHLKMLQKDVEIFKALMEEVKNELLVTKT
jgi:hypothetical protein